MSCLGLKGTVGRPIVSYLELLDMFMAGDCVLSVPDGYGRKEPGGYCLRPQKTTTREICRVVLKFWSIIHVFFFVYYSMTS